MASVNIWETPIVKELLRRLKRNYGQKSKILEMIRKREESSNSSKLLNLGADAFQPRPYQFNIYEQKESSYNAELLNPEADIFQPRLYQLNKYEEKDSSYNAKLLNPEAEIFQPRHYQLNIHEQKPSSYNAKLLNPEADVFQPRPYQLNIYVVPPPFFISPMAPLQCRKRFITNPYLQIKQVVDDDSKILSASKFKS